MLAVLPPETARISFPDEKTIGGVRGSLARLTDVYDEETVIVGFRSVEVSLGAGVRRCNFC